LSNPYSSQEASPRRSGQFGQRELRIGSGRTLTVMCERWLCAP
jgi:hypothetical protein